MTLTNDDLQAISYIIDEKFDSICKRIETIDGRLEIMELKQDRTSRKLDDLRLEVKAF